MIDSLLSSEASTLTDPPAAVSVPTIVASAPLVTVNSSAAKGLLLSIVTGFVRAAGVALMAHGAMTQATANAVEPIIIQEITGTTLLVAGQAWASLREWLSHQKTWAAAFTNPSDIVVK